MATNWTTIAERSFEAGGSTFIPSWPKTPRIREAMESARRGHGFTAIKRISADGTITEMLLYKEAGSD